MLDFLWGLRKSLVGEQTPLNAGHRIKCPMNQSILSPKIYVFPHKNHEESSKKKDVKISEMWGGVLW